MTVFTVAEKRRSVKKFSKKKPDWRAILECIDLARHAPTTGGIFPLKFILVNNKETIEGLAKFSEQDFFKDVHYVVVVCSKPSRITNLFPKKGESFSKQQTGAAIENFLLGLQEKKLSSCWIGHFRENEVKKLLSIPGDVSVEAFFPIGFSFKEEKPKKRIDLDNILFFEEWDNKKMKSFRKLDV